jgi:DNA-binding beta-propeller fold protein YncE
MTRSLLIGFLLVLISVACMKDDELWDFEPLQTERPSRGLFVVNEGNFTYGNASLSYYDMETGEVFNDAFFLTNGLPLGDVAVSMTIRDSLGYIVVNNSGRIYVVNTATFKYEGKITGLTSPRHIHFISDTKAYVTDLYARSVAVVNPLTMERTGTINVSNGSPSYFRHPTEQMVRVDRFIYTNCWSFDRLILVIDSEEDRVVDSIEVLKQPNSMVLDRHRTLWVLCDGGFPESPYGYENGGLLKIVAGATEARIVYRFARGDAPTELNINGTGDTLYFLNRHVYRMPVSAETEPEIVIPSPYPQGYNGGYYGLGVDASSTEIYVSDAMDFTQPGIIYRCSPDGFPLDTFQAGVVPGAFCFKPAD